MMRDIKSTDENEGRAAKGFSTEERIKRWGMHFVRSIIRAHELQLCHNYKDPGVQQYGGKLFKEIQGQCDILFCNLPPPQPTGIHPNYSGGRRVGRLSHNAGRIPRAHEAAIPLVGHRLPVHKGPRAHDEPIPFGIERNPIQRPAFRGAVSIERSNPAVDYIPRAEPSYFPKAEPAAASKGQLSR